MVELQHMRSRSNQQRFHLSLVCRLFNDEEREILEKTRGSPISEGARFPNKRAYRITVRLPRGDRALVLWRKWAKKRLDPNWYAALAKAGGQKDKTWYLYFGTIPPDWFTGIDQLSN